MAQFGVYFWSNQLSGGWAIGQKIALGILPTGSSSEGGEFSEKGKSPDHGYTKGYFLLVCPYEICKTEYLKLGCPGNYGVYNFFGQQKGVPWG